MLNPSRPYSILLRSCALPRSRTEKENIFSLLHTPHMYPYEHVRTYEVSARSTTALQFLCPPLLAVERQVRSERARPPNARTHVVAVGFFTGIGCLPPPCHGLAGHGCLRRLRGNHAALPGVVGEYRSEMRHLRGWGGWGWGGLLHMGRMWMARAARPGPARLGRAGRGGGGGKEKASLLDPKKEVQNCTEQYFLGEGLKKRKTGPLGTPQ